MRIFALQQNKLNYTSSQTKKNDFDDLNQPAFAGMTKILKRKIFLDGKKDILEILKKRKPNQNSYAGQLPPGIFEAIRNKPYKKSAIKEILTTFSEIAAEIRDFKSSSNKAIEELRNRRSNSTVEKLKNLFKKYNLKNTNEDVDIIFLGRGDYGSGFKLTGIHDNITNDIYMLKVHTLIDKTPNWHRYKSHGCYSELNSAVYWTKKWGWNSQRGKFYFGSINDGFMVDNFISEKTAKYKKLVNEYKAGLKLTDEELANYGHNKINGYSIDWGGIRVVNRTKNQSKTATYVLNQIKKTSRHYRAGKWWEIYNNNKLDKVQKQAGLALAIKHLNNKPFYIEECLKMREPFVDQSLAYLLKYLPHEEAKFYFERLAQRKEPLTQTVLMNEIPLLSRKPLPEAYDDMNIPKEELYPDKIRVFYSIAKKYATEESREHLASYIHLLPQADIMQEFQKLIDLKDYNIFDRLLHKIRTVPETEFPFDLKFKMLDKILESTNDPYLQKHGQELKIYTLRKTLED